MIGDYRVIRRQGVYYVQQVVTDGDHAFGSYWETVEGGVWPFSWDRKFKSIEDADAYIRSATTKDYEVVER